MIQANEIRIGNYFQHDNVWSYRNDACVAFNFQWLESDWYALVECTLDLQYINPIPITEDLLIKLGFFKDVVFYYLDIGNKTFLVSGGKAVWVEKILDDGKDFSIGLDGAESVHQLQTLYFALCNKELDVNNLSTNPTN